MIGKRTGIMSFNLFLSLIAELRINNCICSYILLHQYKIIVSLDMKIMTVSLLTIFFLVND